MKQVNGMQMRQLDTTDVESKKQAQNQIQDTESQLENGETPRQEIYFYKKQLYKSSNYTSIHSIDNFSLLRLVSTSSVFAGTASNSDTYHHWTLYS